MQGRTFGVACDECKFVTSWFTAQWKTLQKLQGKAFVYCPLCGKQGTSLDNGIDISWYQDAYRLGMSIEVIRTFRMMYKEYISEQTKANARIEHFDKWIMATIKEFYSAAQV